MISIKMKLGAFGRNLYLWFNLYIWYILLFYEPGYVQIVYLHTGQIMSVEAWIFIC